MPSCASTPRRRSLWPRSRGGLWGIGAGLGRTWLAAGERPIWQTAPLITLCCAALFVLGERFGNALEASPLWAEIVLGGGLPLMILTAAALADRLRGFLKQERPDRFFSPAAEMAQLPAAGPEG